MTTKTFAITGPISLVARVGHGSLRVVALDDLTEVSVTATARIELSQTLDHVTVDLRGTTLAINSPRSGGVFDLFGDRRRDAIDVEVTVPTGTPVTISSHDADVTVLGRCGDADIAVAAAAVRTEHVGGDLHLRYGSGSCHIERVSGAVRLKSGSGPARIGEVGGALAAVCGSGRLDVGTARAAVRFRAGSGGAAFGAVYDDVDLASGSGGISIGVPAGVSAKVDLTSGSGHVDPQLPISETSTAAGRAITIRARTGNGDIRLFRAVA